jgi:site-specific DNA-cytosine methylase
MSVKVLELFSGSGSLGKQARRMGLDVFSVDNVPFPGTSLVADIEFLTPSDIPFAPDIIWASIPCTSYSLAGISHHREPDGTPKSDFAAKSDRLSKNVIALLKAYPDAIYYIENPRATLRQMEYMHGLPAPITVWYCRYGDKRAKPTDIWTNNQRTLFNKSGWSPRPECWNGNKGCHHEAAPRGSKTGTQGLKNDYERSKVPSELCMEILLASVNVTPKMIEG